MIPHRDLLSFPVIIVRRFGPWPPPRCTTCKTKSNDTPFRSRFRVDRSRKRKIIKRKVGAENPIQSRFPYPYGASISRNKPNWPREVGRWTRIGYVLTARPTRQVRQLTKYYVPRECAANNNNYRVVSRVLSVSTSFLWTTIVELYDVIISCSSWTVARDQTNE